MPRGIMTEPRKARNRSGSATVGSWPVSSSSCRSCPARCVYRSWPGCGGPRRTGKIAYAREMAELIAARHPDRTVHVVGDAAYVGEHLRGLNNRITWTSRLKVTSVPHELPPPRTGRSGRPRTKGARLGTATDIAVTATWRTTRVRRYGRTDTVHIAEVVCLWYGSFHTRPMRVILVRDDKPRTLNGDDRGYGLPLVTTDLESTAEELVTRYASRWGIEQAFADARQVIGVGEAHNRLRCAVERTVPFGLTCLSLITIWYALHGHAPDDIATLWVPKIRPCRSRGVSVLVDDSTESILSMHGEAMGLVGLKGVRQGTKWCSGGEGSVGAVLVVMPLVLPQRMP